MGEDREWVNLEEWVVRMIEEGKLSSNEFQAALRVWGKQKIDEIWQKHQEKNNGKESSRVVETGGS